MLLQPLEWLKQHSIVTFYGFFLNMFERILR